MYVYQAFPEERVRVSVFPYLGSLPTLDQAAPLSLSGSISASRRVWIRDGGGVLFVDKSTKYEEFCTMAAKLCGLEFVSYVFTEQGEPLEASSFELFPNQVVFVSDDEPPAADEEDAFAALLDETMHGGGDWADGGRRALRESRENFRESFASSFGGIEKFGSISHYVSQQLAEIDALQAAVGNDVIVGASFPLRALMYVRHEQCTEVFLSLCIRFPPRYPEAVPVITVQSGSTAVLLGRTLNHAECLENLMCRLGEARVSDGMLFDAYSVVQEWLGGVVLGDELHELQRRMQSKKSGATGASLKHIFPTWRYSSVTPSSLLQARISQRQLIASRAGIDQHAALEILRAERWKVGHLLRQLRSGLDGAELKRRYNVQEMETSWYGDLEGTEELECSICEDLFPIEDMTCLPCGHWFDNECYELYVRSRVKDGTADGIDCPAPKCKMLVDEATVASLLSEEEFSRYMHFLLSNFVEHNENIVWCPRSKCGQAIESRTVSRTPGFFVVCDCGRKFCFGCRGTPHWPAPCQTVEWNNTQFGPEEAPEEELNAQWLAAHTKKCPKCQVDIEKNMGCNHMTCRKCMHNFCWVCLAPFSPQHYSCRKAAPKGPQGGKVMIGGLTYAMDHSVKQTFTALHDTRNILRSTLLRRYNTFYSERRRLPSGFSGAESEVEIVLDHLMMALNVAHGVCLLGRHVKALGRRGSRRLKLSVIRLLEYVWVLMDMLYCFNAKEVDAFKQYSAIHTMAVVQLIRDLAVEVKHMSPEWTAIVAPENVEVVERVEERVVRITVHHNERYDLAPLCGFMHTEMGDFLEWCASSWKLHKQHAPKYVFIRSGAMIRDTRDVVHNDDLYVSTCDIFAAPQELVTIDDELMQQELADSQWVAESSCSGAASSDAAGSGAESSCFATGEQDGRSLVVGIPEQVFLAHERELMRLAQMFPALSFKTIFQCYSSSSKDLERAAAVLLNKADTTAERQQRHLDDQEIRESSVQAPADDSAVGTLRLLNMQYAHKIQQIQAAIPSVTFEEGRSVLKKCGGDVELAIVQLMGVEDNDAGHDPWSDESEEDEPDLMHDGVYVSENEWY